jgi:hypothetical protein
MWCGAKSTLRVFNRNNVKIGKYKSNYNILGSEKAKKEHQGVAALVFY